MSVENNSPASAESSSEVCSAAEALKRAKEELAKAQAFYESVRKEAAQRYEAVRETCVGDLIDGTLEAVKRHPGAGLIIAALIGFFLGRGLRR